jgi:hypothetical protein
MPFPIRCKGTLLLSLRRTMSRNITFRYSGNPNKCHSLNYCKIVKIHVLNIPPKLLCITSGLRNSKKILIKTHRLRTYISSHNTEDTIEYRWAFSAGLLSLLIWSKTAKAGCVRVPLHLFTPAMIKSVVNETIL